MTGSAIQFLIEAENALPWCYVLAGFSRCFRHSSIGPP